MYHSCMLMCISIYIYIHTHTHTLAKSSGQRTVRLLAAPSRKQKVLATFCIHLVSIARTLSDRHPS